jgi:catechol-2,3-dioxygenase
MAVANPRLPEFDENSPLRPARFGHIVLQTKRFKQMAPWYKKFLNAEALFEIPHGAFLTFDDEHHRVLIIDNPNAVDRPEGAEGVAHWAYLFNSLKDLMTSYERLRDEEGVTPTYCVNHGFQFSLYYHDPDKNEVELGCDNFKSREAMNEWFENGEFAKNFFGYNFDPEEVWKKHKAGVEDQQIFADTYQGDAPDLSSFFEED